ncbi:MAG TPA: L,D-transpeptidase family protein [Methyloceanibacter sp.]
MRAGYLVAILLGTAQALALAGAGPVRAQDSSTQPLTPPLTPPTLEPSLKPLPPPPEVQPTPSMPLAAPEASPTSPEATPPPADAPPLTAVPIPADPVVASIRVTLGDPALRKDENADDLAALEAFYAARAAPLWMTEMGFSAKGQQALFEIEKAGDWGLDPADFELPLAAALPATPEAQGLAELKLNLAILKYARYARGGRFTPSKISSLFDQRPPLRDPKIVLVEIEAADAPDAYLQSLHPKHEQFVRLRQALLKARGASENANSENANSEDGKSEDVKSEDVKPAGNERDIKLLVINMERWRWMPENLGSIHVWNNSAAFMLYVVKDGKTIFADKTLVGTIGYATPVFTTPMTTIVFNPDWNAPETVVKENILPPLQRKNYSILRVHKLFVSYNGTPVDPTKVDWNRVNVLNYTFSQRAGPHNNLGKVKFLYPNRHTVYMHDTLPVRKKFFKKPVRTIGHECVRMEKPIRFAEILLAESNGWPAARVKELWDKGVNSSVALEKKIPVHMVYFTAVVDESGKVETSADVYGLDRKLTMALFGNATGFPEPPPEPEGPQVGAGADASGPARRNTADNDFARSMQGFLGE